jgi:hypothetical protein
VQTSETLTGSRSEDYEVAAVMIQNPARRQDKSLGDLSTAVSSGYVEPIFSGQKTSAGLVLAYLNGHALSNSHTV